MKVSSFRKSSLVLSPLLFSALLSSTALGETLAFGADFHERYDILRAHLTRFYSSVEAVGIAGDLPDGHGGTADVLGKLTVDVVNKENTAGAAVLYTEGNHDDYRGGVGNMTPATALHYNVCGLSSLNAAVFREDVVNDLKGCLEGYRTSSRAGKVTYIMSHLPLHSNRDDGNDNDDDLGTPNSLRKAAELFSLLQEYGRQMNLVFLWGHDHFRAPCDAALQTFPGGTIGGTVFVNPAIASTPLRFTNYNAGYITKGQMSKSSLTATWFRFYRSYVDETNPDTGSGRIEQVGATFGRFTSIAAGNYHSCGIRAGAVYCWGHNGNGQLGNGTTVRSATPVPVTGLTAGATQVSVGMYHSCAIVKGAAKCWGYNGAGRLGNNSTVSSTTPVSVSGLGSVNTVREISAGQSHTCAVVSGVAQCWGEGADGALGNGSTARSLVPVQVVGLDSDVTRISAGSVHSCAVRNGAAKCWGGGANGVLGNNSTVSRSTPVSVTGLGSNVMEISAGSTHSCAVAGGVAYCWGANESGQLGDYTTTMRLTPVNVTHLTSGVTDISAGTGSSCATNYGTLVCWGRNGNGQLGDGSTTTRYNANLVTGLASGVTQIDQGAVHGCAIHNGYAKCWGNNGYGQLGNGTLTSSYTAVEATP